MPQTVAELIECRLAWYLPRRKIGNAFGYIWCEVVEAVSMAVAELVPTSLACTSSVGVGWDVVLFLFFVDES